MALLTDSAARRDAIAIHDRSFLVEAGAGSGKTAIMAGRIALMLAEGVAPRAIAAVTFTELAASELLIRVRDFVTALLSGQVPVEMRAALPGGLTDVQTDYLARASETLDDITCSTIHGFCQTLIKPYPVEAGIDPGANVMDAGQADSVFDELTQNWLRAELEHGDGTLTLLPELVLHDMNGTLKLLHAILANLRRHRGARVAEAEPLAPLVAAFVGASAEFSALLTGQAAEEAETQAIADGFAELAAAVDIPLVAATGADIARLLFTSLPEVLVTRGGGFKSYRNKGKWTGAAKAAGLSKAAGEQLNLDASNHYAVCCVLWERLSAALAGHVLAALTEKVGPVLDRFRQYKHNAALLDFDDLIFAARDLLRDHENVRRALANRFAHVLVDEFQDTDPLQTEIFWRLCGEPADGADPHEDWRSFRIRPGALFLVGDPKQAIYRFRGADIAAYTQARDALTAQDAQSLLTISTNFRSRAPVLVFVNAHFRDLLSQANGQPGFTELQPFHPSPDDEVAVAALDIAAADENGKASADQLRDAEAEAVASLCAHLVATHTIIDRATGASRPCRPGDIALLAPMGTDLWRYEQALESLDIPVATQAGKGFYGRQEVQDLIAITRAIADPRDRLALGALLRGPVVGLSEEELLDIVWHLPRADHAPDQLPRLDIGVDPEHIGHPLARDVIARLQGLRRKVNATTPHDLLSQAVDELRLRPILLQRHRGQAERALANVDLYLSLTRAWGVRGLRTFSDAMTQAWTDAERSMEGRPDAQEEAVSLYTIHASKGLEWPIVIPINGTSKVMSPDAALIDRNTGLFRHPVFGKHPPGYTAAREREEAELERERIRLWYVALTRARDLLVLPRFDVRPGSRTWSGQLNLPLDDLAAIGPESNSVPTGLAVRTVGSQCQTREVFVQEAAFIASRQHHLLWQIPSRDEDAAGPLMNEPEPVVLRANADGITETGGVEEPRTFEVSSAETVRGSRLRGLLLHKLIEEVLTGETPDTAQALESRAADLIRALGAIPSPDPAQGLAPAELAGCINRALALPEIAALRPRLLPELPVHAATRNGTQEQIVAGVADAIALDASGNPEAVIDWKSDIAPTTETLAHYRKQVQTYLAITGASKGYIVLLTEGRIITVSGSRPS